MTERYGAGIGERWPLGYLPRRRKDLGREALWCHDAVEDAPRQRLLRAQDAIGVNQF
jgi:hypothetical protein